MSQISEGISIIYHELTGDMATMTHSLFSFFFLVTDHLVESPDFILLKYAGFQPSKNSIPHVPYSQQ